MDKSAIWPTYQEHRSASPTSNNNNKSKVTVSTMYGEKGNPRQPRRFKTANSVDNLPLNPERLEPKNNDARDSSMRLEVGQYQDSLLSGTANSNIGSSNLGNSRQSLAQINFLFNPARQDLIGSILNNYLTYNNQNPSNGIPMSNNPTANTNDSQLQKSQLVDANYPSEYLNNQDPSINGVAMGANTENVRPRGDSFFLPPPINSQIRLTSNDYDNAPNQNANNGSRSNSIFSSLIQIPSSGHNSVSDAPGSINFQKTNPNNTIYNNNNNSNINSAGGINSKMREDSVSTSNPQGGNYLIPLSEFEDSLGKFLALQQQDPKGSQLGLKSKRGSIDPINNAFWENLNNGMSGSINGMPINGGSISGILASLSNGSVDLSNMNGEQRRNSILKVINDQQNFQSPRTSNSTNASTGTKLREDIFNKNDTSRKSKESYDSNIAHYNSNSLKTAEGLQHQFSPTSSMSSKSSVNVKYNDEPQSPKTSPSTYHANLNQQPTRQPYPEQPKQYYQPLMRQNYSIEPGQQQYNASSYSNEAPIVNTGNTMSPTTLKPPEGAMNQPQLPNYPNSEPQYVPQFQSYQQFTSKENPPVQLNNNQEMNNLDDKNLVPAQQFLKAEDGRPLLGATKIDQLMLVIQARDKGVSNPIQQAPDGSILASPKIKSENGVIPQPMNLVGGVDKPQKDNTYSGSPDDLGSQMGSPDDQSNSKKRKTKNKQCPYCFKYFTQSTHLEVHVRSHIGYKPFECSYCHKRFTQGGNLRTHLRLHTGEKPFTCEICKRSFSRKGNLAAHKLTHENLKPYECKLDNCDKSFTQLGNLKSHQNRFHLSTLNELTQKLAEFNGEEINNLPKDEKDLLNYFKDLYKNSNKGILGRGKRIKPVNEMNVSKMEPSW